MPRADAGGHVQEVQLALVRSLHLVAARQALGLRETDYLRPGSILRSSKGLRTGEFRSAILGGVGACWNGDIVEARGLPSMTSMNFSDFLTPLSHT